ncbi:MAG TPA: DeoR/GlpR family DNA-binding transcription regulator [Planctomycetota bacterium]|nr:DeoR/GlpR family DNA-binding transcription regulator [Planctomycetota bacterium]
MGHVERQRDIETVLQTERKVLVEDLSQRFGVSEVTIRKDLTELENRGVLLRTHGGAVLAEKPELVVPMHRRSTEQVSEKNLIAKAAAARIKDGESILLDTGSTTLSLARELRGRNLNVVTNSVLIATELAADEQISIIVLGGTLRRSSFALMGALALEQLKTLHVDRAFLGASGFDPKAGFSCQNLIEAETKRAMVHSAHEAVLLVDHSKFDRSAFAPFCSPKEVDCVITDAPLSRTAVEALQRANVEIVVSRP